MVETQNKYPGLDRVTASFTVWEQQTISDALRTKAQELRREATKLAKHIGKWEDPDVSRLVTEAAKIEELEKDFKL